MAAPIVSIIVPSLHRPQPLQRSLTSIASTVKIPHEVIVVAVAGDEQTLAMTRALPVQTIIQHTRGGAVQAMNLGFRAATGVYLIQINDDCELLPHSVANAIRFLEAPRNADIGQAAFFHDSPPPRNGRGRRNVHAQIEVENTWYYTYHVRGLCYANFGLARRELYEQLNYFDERFFMYGADPDFSLKVWHEAKLRVEPCPGALIRHVELDDDRGATERAVQHEDNQKLFAKWGLD